MHQGQWSNGSCTIFDANYGCVSNVSDFSFPSFSFPPLSSPSSLPTPSLSLAPSSECVCSFLLLSWFNCLAAGWFCFVACSALRSCSSACQGWVPCAFSPPPSPHFLSFPLFCLLVECFPLPVLCLCCFSIVSCCWLWLAVLVPSLLPSSPLVRVRVRVRARVCVCVCVCVSCYNKQAVTGQLLTRAMQGDRALWCYSVQRSYASEREASTGHGCVPANIFQHGCLHVKESCDPSFTILLVSTMR